MTVADSPVVDGQVRVACSLFPVDVLVNGFRSDAARFMLIEDDGGWIAAAWVGTREVHQAVYEKVSEITEYSTKAIRMITDAGTVDVLPSRNCGCGRAVLRSYNPFGPSVTLVLVAKPESGR